MEKIKVYKVSKYIERKCFQSEYFEDLDSAEQFYNITADSSGSGYSWSLKLEELNIPIQKVLVSYLNKSSWYSYDEYAFTLREIV